MNFNDTDFLNEEKLYDYLIKIFPETEWIKNKKICDSKLKTRPDYHSKTLKFIVEFDGDRYCSKSNGHYSNASIIIKDYEKDSYYSSINWKTIRIPYFVQICPKSIYDLFTVKNLNIKQIYPHGFIDKFAKLPVDYNELGIKRFENDLNRFPSIKPEIILSLKNKISELNNIDLVLPEKLKYLVR